MEQIQTDLKSREKIIHDINHNYFVEAGAGSGKTTVLVKRIVSMIEQGLDISKICAITFTKAAANEFYSRLQSALAKRSKAETVKDYVYNPLELDNPSDISRKRCEEALRNIDMAFLGTIDSFCNMVESEHPSIIGIPSSASVLDDDELRKQLLIEYKRIESGSYGQSLREEALNFKNYHKSAEKAFVESFITLMSNRSFPVKYEKPKKELTLYQSISALKTLVEYLKEHLDCVLENEQKARDSKEALDNYFYVFEKKYDNIPLLIRALKAISKIRISPNHPEIFENYPDFLKAHDEKKLKHYCLNEKFDDLLKLLTEQQYSVTVDFVLKCQNVILDKFKKEGKLTFYDYLLYLRDALRKDAQSGGKLIKHIYSRHSYFLIDEFQDTDPLQVQIFFYLAAKKIDPRWDRCIPYPGSLFIVGDPKQSIYRFKNADVSNFLNIRSMFKGKTGEVLYLYQNFRSADVIKQYFNRTFELLLPFDTFEQARYPLIPVNNEIKDDLSNAYYYEVNNADEDMDAVVNIILSLYNDEQYQIYDRNIKKLRKLDYKDFMIITPGKPKLTKYTKKLKSMNIPFYVEGKFDYNDSLVLINLVKLFEAVNTDDNKALYNVLSGELFNFSDEQIYSDNYNVNNSKELIIKLKEKSKGLNPSEILVLFLKELNPFIELGNENMEYVYYLIEQLRNKENTNEIITIYDAITFFERILNDNDVERYPDLSKSSNKVHLANLHKVKGLEAPVVILAAPARKNNKASFRCDKNDECIYQFAISPKKAFAPIVKTEMYEEAKTEEEISLMEEEKRLVYVAATRARNLLIVGLNKTKSGAYSASNIWYPLFEGGLFNLNNRLKDARIELNERKLIKPSEVDPLQDYDDSLSKIKVSERIVPSALVEYENKTVTENHKKDPLLIGSIVHRLLELCVKYDFRLSETDLLKEINKEYSLNNDAYYLNILAKVYNTMNNCGYKQKNGFEQDLFKLLKESDEKYPELKFSYREEDKYYLGVIDLLFKKDNKYCIIDYKTNFEEDGLDEHYRSQLEVYKKALKDLKNIDAEIYIYHIEV
ncbi:MAG: UvrD-helicase domain-containing protein [Erysipelotrichaceae bacterium]